MAATAFTALAFTSFTNQHEQGPEKAFQLSWWFWLAMTGLGLGMTVSIKWVGLFTIAWVGTLTLVQLWVLLGDTRTVTLVGLDATALSHPQADSVFHSAYLPSTSRPASSA